MTYCKKGVSGSAVTIEEDSATGYLVCRECPMSNGEDWRGTEPNMVDHAQRHRAAGQAVPVEDYDIVNRVRRP